MDTQFHILVHVPLILGHRTRVRVNPSPRHCCFFFRGPLRPMLSSPNAQEQVPGDGRLGGGFERGVCMPVLRGKPSYAAAKHGSGESPEKENCLSRGQDVHFQSTCCRGKDDVTLKLMRLAGPLSILLSPRKGTANPVEPNCLRKLDHLCLDPFTPWLPHRLCPPTPPRLDRSMLVHAVREEGVDSFMTSG